MKYLISACLCGINCKYDGTNNLNLNIKKLYDDGLGILVCPELLGGLLVPRVSCEINNDKVIDLENNDKTINFINGAKKVLEIALENNVSKCIFKDKSPSCGVNYIYDGSFKKKLINGCGITTRLLKENGIEVISDVIYK